MEILNTEANYPKLAEKNPAALVVLAKRLINDPNVSVMLQAEKLIGLLAKGQRKYFEQYAKMFFPIFLSKLKDKKTQVIQETFLNLENLLYSVNLEQVLDDIREALEDKTPTLKINASLWLQKVYSSLPVDQLTKSVKNVGLMIKKNIDDSIAEVRTESVKLLNALYKRFPEPISSILKDLPQAKIRKIEEFSENQDPDEEETKKLQKMDQLLQKVEKIQNKQEKPAKPEKLKKENTKTKESTKQNDEETTTTTEEVESTIQSLLPPNTFEKLKESS